MIVFILFLCSLIISFCKGFPMSIVQCDVSCSMDSSFYNETFILISGYLKKLVTPFDTLSSIKPDFNSDKDIIKIPISILENLIIGKDIPAIKRKSLLPDDVVLFELQITHALQDFEPVLLSKQIICEGCKNPSMVLWNNQAMLVYESRLQPRKLNYFWMNTTDHPLITKQYLGVDEYIPHKDSQTMIQGADARLVAFSDEIIYIAVEQPSFHVSFSTLAKKGNQIIASETIQILPDKNPNAKHKNWTPFSFNNTLYFLQTVNPLHVVTLEKSSGNYLAKTISITNSNSLKWSFGEMRGGSNPVNIGNNMFLGFFHSRYSINFNTLTTYVFGAYTFTAAPIFKLTGVSKFPIYIDSLHQGEWFSKYFDYVVYPTSLFINSSDDSVYLTVGHNDLTGYLLKFSLNSVLKSLTPLV